MSERKAILKQELQEAGPHRCTKVVVHVNGQRRSYIDRSNCEPCKTALSFVFKRPSR